MLFRITTLILDNFPTASGRIWRVLRGMMLTSLRARVLGKFPKWISLEFSAIPQRQSSPALNRHTSPCIFLKCGVLLLTPVSAKGNAGILAETTFAFLHSQKEQAWRCCFVQLWRERRRRGVDRCSV